MPLFRHIYFLGRGWWALCLFLVVFIFLERGLALFLFLDVFIFFGEGVGFMPLFRCIFYFFIFYFFCFFGELGVGLNASF